MLVQPTTLIFDKLIMNPGSASDLLKLVWPEASPGEKEVIKFLTLPYI